MGNNLKSTLILTTLFIITITTIVVFKNAKQEKTWKNAKEINTPTAYQDYLNEYPNGKYAIIADSLFDESLWKETNDSCYFEAYQNYINFRPSGHHVEEAKKILQRQNELPELSNRFKIQKKIVITFENHERFLALFTYRNIAEDDPYIDVQLNIYKLNKGSINTNKKIWTKIWASPIEDAMIHEQFIGTGNTKRSLDLRLYHLKGKNKAVVLSEQICGSWDQYFGVIINNSGKIEPIENSKRFNKIEKINDVISVHSNSNRLNFSIIDNKLSIESISKSDMTPEGAVKSTFELDEYNNIRYSQTEYELSEGQTLAVVPVGKSTIDAFNNGNIGIFTNNCDKGDKSDDVHVLTGRVWDGNSIKFDVQGVYKVVLRYETDNYDSKIFDDEYDEKITVIVNSKSQDEKQVSSSERKQHLPYFLYRSKWVANVGYGDDCSIKFINNNVLEFYMYGLGTERCEYELEHGQIIFKFYNQTIKINYHEQTETLFRVNGLNDYLQFVKQ